MTKLLLLMMVGFSVLAVNEVKAQNSTLLSTNQQYALINSIKNNENGFLIDADFVQIFTGKAALRAAKIKGEAEYDIGAKGDTAWYVPNDFFIVNNNTTIRQLKISSSAIIYLLKDGSSIPVKGSISKLQKNYRHKYFKLTLHKNNIIKLNEMYLP